MSPDLICNDPPIERTGENMRIMHALLRADYAIRDYSDFGYEHFILKWDKIISVGGRLLLERDISETRLLTIKKWERARQNVQPINKKTISKKRYWSSCIGGKCPRHSKLST